MPASFTNVYWRSLERTLFFQIESILKSYKTSPRNVKIRLGFFKNLFSICFLNLWKLFYKLFYTFIKWNLLNKFVAGFFLIYVCKIQFTLRICLKVSQSSRFDFSTHMIIIFKMNKVLFIWSPQRDYYFIFTQH